MGPRPEYPRPALRRAEWQSLNGEWEFGAGEEAVFDRRIVVPFCPESELSGIGERVDDVVWYRRRFDTPAAPRLLLHFGRPRDLRGDRAPVLPVGRASEVSHV